jgi:hypothetical protein
MCEEGLEIYCGLTYSDVDWVTDNAIDISKFLSGHYKTRHLLESVVCIVSPVNIAFFI